MQNVHVISFHSKRIDLGTTRLEPNRIYHVQRDQLDATTMKRYGAFLAIANLENRVIFLGNGLSEPHLYFLSKRFGWNVPTAKNPAVTEEVVEVPKVTEPAPVQEAVPVVAVVEDVVIPEQPATPAVEVAPILSTKEALEDEFPGITDIEKSDDPDSETPKKRRGRGHK